MENLFFDIKKLKYVGENVIIGKTVRIRNPEKCMIGSNTIIDDFAYISSPINIGRYCHIASHVSISGSKYMFSMDDFSTISNHCSIHCASSDYSTVSLDLPSVPEEYRFGGEGGNVSFGPYVTIGSHSVVLPCVYLPDGFACGAFSLIKEQNYQPWSLYAGVPAKIIKERGKWDFQNRRILL